MTMYVPKSDYKIMPYRKSPKENFNQIKQEFDVSLRDWNKITKKHKVDYIRTNKMNMPLYLHLKSDQLHFLRDPDLNKKSKQNLLKIKQGQAEQDYLQRVQVIANQSKWD